MIADPSLPVGGSTGLSHVHSEAITEAANWYATLPAHERGRRPAVPLLKERFGLSAREACEAVREAALVRARAL